MIDRSDVVVVGAGPVGLLLAIELRLGGAAVTVLERLAAPSPTIKALGVGPLGVEELQRRGMADALAAADERKLAEVVRTGGKAGRSTKFVGHFGGLFLTRSDTQREPERRMRLVDQQSLEAILGARAAALGIAVRRECTLAGFAQDGDGIDVAIASPAGEARIRCRYLVGCDGGRSTVRKTAGFGFPGTEPTLTMYQALVTLDHPERLSSAGWQRTPGGTYSYGLFADRLFMIDFSGPPADREAPVTAGEVEAVLRRVSGADVRVASLGVANRWTDNTRLADDYRLGRVLLAGDAAHVHSPFGGQGLSLGLGDAANLGWKLAAVIRGEMPAALLDSYAAERRPVAEAVLANTLAQTAIMRPDPQSGALRELLADLMKRDEVTRVFEEMIRGLATRYDLGSARDEVGRSAGDRALGDAGTLYGLMQEGDGVLLDASAGGEATRLVAAARVRCVRVATGPSMLVRPDGCIAWAGDGDLNGLEAAVRRWFGGAADSLAA